MYTRCMLHRDGVPLAIFYSDCILGNICFTRSTCFFKCRPRTLVRMYGVGRIPSRENWVAASIEYVHTIVTAYFPTYLPDG